MNSRRIDVMRALYFSILSAETSPSLLSIENYGVESLEMLNCRKNLFTVVSELRINPAALYTVNEAV
jgi:hypothetical protein